MLYIGAALFTALQCNVAFHMFQLECRRMGGNWYSKNTRWFWNRLRSEGYQVGERLRRLQHDETYGETRGMIVADPDTYTVRRRQALVHAQAHPHRLGLRRRVRAARAPTHGRRGMMWPAGADS